MKKSLFGSLVLAASLDMGGCRSTSEPVSANSATNSSIVSELSVDREQHAQIQQRQCSGARGELAAVEVSLTYATDQVARYERIRAERQQMRAAAANCFEQHCMDETRIYGEDMLMATTLVQRFGAERDRTREHIVHLQEEIHACESRDQ